MQLVVTSCFCLVFPNMMVVILKFGKQNFKCLLKVFYQLKSKNTSSEAPNQSRIYQLTVEQLNEIFFFTKYSLFLIHKWEIKAKIFLFFWKNDQNMPLLMDSLSGLVRSAPQKCEGANWKKAWIIHENEKSSMSWTTVSKCIPDWLWVSNNAKK